MIFHAGHPQVEEVLEAVAEEGCQGAGGGAQQAQL